MCGNSATGNPIPTISWTDNSGTNVSDGSGISGSDTLMLTITSVTRNHTGNWTCSAENSIRDVERQIMLVVVGEYVYKVVSHLRLVTVSIFIVCLCWCLHRRRNRSGWSGFNRTTFPQETGGRYHNNNKHVRACACSSSMQC